MAGFTPGPWATETDPCDGQDYETLVILQPCKTWIARTEHNWRDAGFGERRISWAEAQANARLIAAAPDMFEALLTERDYVADAASGGLTYEGSGEGFMAMAKEDLARIDAAIAKAKGETK